MTTDLYQTPALEASRRPIVIARDGEVFANSRDVAAYFAKDHNHVLRDIDALIAAAPDLGLSKFGQTPYVHPQNGQTYRSFDMTRDGFSLLAMGFTGGKALRWKLAYIEAFNSMEAELRKSPSIVLDYSDPKVLLGVLDHLQTKVAEQQAVIEEQVEKVKKLVRIEESVGSLAITDAAKTLKVGRDWLIRFMQARSWIYKRLGSSNWLGRQEKINAGYLEHREHLYLDSQGQERVSTSVRITGKGLVKLAELLNEKVH